MLSLIERLIAAATFGARLCGYSGNAAKARRRWRAVGPAPEHDSNSSCNHKPAHDLERRCYAQGQPALIEQDELWAELFVINAQILVHFIERAEVSRLAAQADMHTWRKNPRTREAK